MRIPLGGLARKLIKDNLLTEAGAEKAAADAARKRIPFVTHLVDGHLVKARDIAMASSQEFGVPLLNLDTLEIDSEVVKQVDEISYAAIHIKPDNRAITH